MQGHGRKEHNIDVRPLAARHRRWETWHHDPHTNAYGMAFAQCYPQDVLIDKATHKKTYGGYYDKRLPLLMIYPNGDIVLDAMYFNSYSTWELIGAMMPEGITFVKYGAKCYFKLDQPEGEPMYFFFPKTNMTFIPYESNGKRYYRVAAPVQEIKYLIDRDAARRAREEVGKFMAYYELMEPMMPTLESEPGWKEKRELEDMLKTGTWLWRKSDEEFGEKWPNAVDALRKMHTHRRAVWNDNGNYDVYIHHPTPEDIKGELSGEKLYRLVEPYRRELVPLGTPFFSNHRD